MKKILLFVILLLSMVSVVTATDSEYGIYNYEYGIYNEDTDFFIVENVTDSKVTYLRDNFYGIAYINDSGHGNIRVVEINGASIINSSVYEWNFGSGVSNIDFISFNNETGLSVISYLSSSVSNYKSFDVYENGTINTRDSKQEFYDSFSLLKTIKTSNTTFMTTMVWSNWASTIFFYNTGYTVGSTGLMTESPSSYKTHKLQDTTTAISYMDMQKIGGTCYMFFKEDGKGKYDTIGCSNLEWSGGGSGSLNADRIYSSTFEANEIYNLYTSYDEDSGFTYLSYGETLDKYPVIAVMNGTTMLYKERLFESTTENNKVFTLSSHYFLGSYTLDNGLYAQSYSVGHDGTFTEEYYRHIFVNSGFHDLIQMPTTYDNYLLAFEGYDDLSIRTMGIGIVPPPGPEETSVTIKDEKTLDNLDFTDLNLTFYAYCDENTAYSTDITSTTTDVPVTCDYESFGIKVNYELSNITYSYTRYYLRDLTDTYGQFDLDVYLINPYTTDYVTTNVLVDDLRTKYTNSRILFEKNIDGTTTQITAFDLDLEDKTRAVLMTDEIYYVYIDSDETTKQFLGKFLSAQAGTIADYKVFSLYDIQMQPNFINLDQKFNYGIFTQDYQIDYKAKTVDGLQNNLINLTVSFYNGTSSDDTLIFNESLGGEYDPDSLYPLLSGDTLNLSDYQNDSVYAEMLIWFSEDSAPYQKPYSVQLWDNTKLELPLTDYIDQSFLDWFLLILLSVTALYATIQSANIAAMGIIGLAALFVMFGWFSISTGTLALAALISLISLLAKKGDRR